MQYTYQCPHCSSQFVGDQDIDDGFLSNNYETECEDCCTKFSVSVNIELDITVNTEKI